MKMHSYLTINGYLYDVLHRSQRAYQELQQLIEKSPSGWEGALREAESARVKAAVTKNGNASITGIDGNGDRDMSINTPEAEVVIRSMADPGTADALRRRLIAVSEGQDTKSSSRELTPDIDNNSNRIESSADTPSFSQTPGQDSSPVACASILTHHPNPAIASSAHTFLDLDSELVSTGPKKLRFPQNVSLNNFIEYMLIPTLVYELEYPRTDR